MTGTSARNSYGIFKSKRAKLLAIEYNLDLYDKNAYIHFGNLISYSDVKNMVNNLWHSHFFYGDAPPIQTSIGNYYKIKYELMSNNFIVS
jgi:hypothetical protein